MNAHITHHHIRTVLSATFATATVLFAASTARATEPLGCQGAKFSTQVRHARCIVHCQTRVPEQVAACEQKCHNRRDRRLAILQGSAVCTGTPASPAPNNSVCDLQLLNAGWRQVKCFLRCRRLAINSDAFDTTRCDNNCAARFDSAKTRILHQAICSQHNGRMPTTN